MYLIYKSSTTFTCIYKNFYLYLQAIKQYKDMALSLTINKVNVAASFAAGATVANAVASGGTAPYVYSLATGGR